MIEAFTASWPLFHNTYLAGWLIGLLLSLGGVLVVARDQIFIGAAIAQASTLGVALAMWIGGWAAAETAPWLHSDGFPTATAVVFSLLAALLTSGTGPSERESPEAITGWAFLGASALAVLIVSHSPHGLEEIHRLVASSIIGATTADLWTFGLLTALTAIALAVAHRRVLLFALDPPMAAAVGMSLWRWRALSAAWLGLVVGLSIRASGMLYTFGCLVLPALIAKNLCREVRSMFVVAPAVAAGTAGLGFVLANYYDFPPAQMAVACLSLLLPAAWLVRGLRQQRQAT